MAIVESNDMIIFVRYYNGTQIARFRGKTASCTSSSKGAAERVAKKVLGDKPFTLKKLYNNEYTWMVLFD